MGTLKYQWQRQIQRPYYLTSPPIRVKRATALVLMLLWLTSGPALPIYCRTYHASNHVTAQSATNSVWTSTGDLKTGRYAHTATLLPDGKVLVVGGAWPDCGTPTSSAELYEPVSGTWSHTGSLNTARVSHTATLLPNGQVLVAGGSVNHYGPQVFLNSAELYDPATGTWRPTGSFNTIRAGTTFFPKGSATLLPNGKVLAIGASDSIKFAVDTAELYDPDTGTWTSTGAPSVGGTMVLLSNGKVLAVSKGFPWDYNGLVAELYDPATEKWTSPGQPNVIQTVDTVTRLRNGKVLVTSALQAELYDTNTGTWSITGSLNASHNDTYGGVSATLLADGRVLVAGGSDSYRPPVGEEVYDPTAGTWSLTNRLNAARSFHSATLLNNGRVLVAGGVDGPLDGCDALLLGGILRSVELYDPAIDPIPVSIPGITRAWASGKKLFVVGENFDPGAVILLNGEEQITKQPAENPQNGLIGKKAGKKIKAGDRLRVRNPNGSHSAEFIFTSS